MVEQDGREAERNKALVLRWLEALVRADVDTALSLMDRDFRYWLGGNMPVSGWHDLDGFFAITKVLGDLVVGTNTMTIGDVAADGDRVFIEAESDMPLTDGGRYNNFYVMATRVRDGKVVELKEFGDTLHTWQVIDHPETRGPAKERETPLTSNTQVWAGSVREMSADER